MTGTGIAGVGTRPPSRRELYGVRGRADAEITTCAWQRGFGPNAARESVIRLLVSTKFPRQTREG